MWQNQESRPQGLPTSSCCLCPVTQACPRAGSRLACHWRPSLDRGTSLRRRRRLGEQGLWVWGRGTLGPGLPGKGLETSREALRSAGRGSQKLQLLCLSCSLRPRLTAMLTSGTCWAGDAGPGPPGLAQEQWQWPSPASLLMPGLNEAVLVICPILPWPALSPQPCLTSLGGHTHTSS